MKANILHELEWRGLIQDCSDPELANKLSTGDPFYVGVDPTARSFQLGNLIPLLVAARLGTAGLKPIILFGGATGFIGDPSGKSKERNLLSREEIVSNIKAQQAQATAIFQRLGASPEFVDNYDWTHTVPVLEFLRDVGKHFTVNYMLAKDAIKSRLEGTGISFTEFSYMLLQSFDFYHLFQEHGCKMQIGGSDQWGNITAGLELIRRKVSGEAFALSFPLLVDSSGKKFGKTEDGAVWLDPELTSPFKFHQFWLNIDDADVVKYLKIFTFFDQEKIQGLEQLTATNPEKREAQRELADSVCTLVHGQQATENAKKGAAVLFGGSLKGLSEQELEEIFSDVPSTTLPAAETRKQTLLELFVSSGAVSSKGEGKRLFSDGGAYLNNERISDGSIKTDEVIAAETQLLVLRTGKKKYRLVKLER